MEKSMGNRRTGRQVDHDTVMELLRRPDYAPMTVDEMAGALGLGGAGRKALADLLRQMMANGEIVAIRKIRYTLGAPADLVTGRIEVKRSGAGYLADSSQPFGVMVDRGDMGTALPGDRVVVRLEPPRHGAPEWQRHGQVIRIVERARRVVVGTLRSTGKFFYVVPMDPSYQQDFYVPDAAGAKLDDRVVVQFTNWENRHVNPVAEIIEVIGPADNPSLDTLAILRNYDLPEKFPEDVMAEAERSAARLAEPGRRLDLRQKFIFTVDPATARDFDDALSLELDGQGRRVLGVHIADVSHFVRPGSALDREATERGNSVYLPDKVIPMLPEELSNGLCSLKPGQDRLTFSVFMTFDGEGRMIGARCERSIIHSKLRLTYEQALQVLETPAGMRSKVPGVTDDSQRLLQDICGLAMTLRQRRMNQHALDIDLPESQILIGKDGMIEDIRPVVNDISHQMIEECMVAANEAVDRELSQRGVRLIHRLHEPPAEDRIELLRDELRDMGYQPGDLRQRGNLMQFVRRIRSTPLAHSAQMAVLRSMKRAVYSAKEGGHFGLAKKYYAHFTSPIRRYPDLVIHRLLAAALERRATPYRPEDLDRLSLHCSETEQAAEQAERDLMEIKKYRFLAQQLEQGKPLEYEAVVVKVANFGLFVELDDLDVQGLVHVSTLSESFVRFDAGARALRAGKDVYKVGTRLRVFAARVDFDKRRIDFAPVRAKAAEAHRQRNEGRSRGRRRG